MGKCIGQNIGYISVRESDANRKCLFIQEEGKHHNGKVEEDGPRAGILTFTHQLTKGPAPLCPLVTLDLLQQTALAEKSPYPRAVFLT